jgi:hypothetical protein
MDHKRAAEVHAAERYLLRELPAEEAEDFERHYFECAECAEAVESGTEFIANAKAVLAAREPQSIRGRMSVGPQKRVRASNWGGWPRWVAVAATVAFAAVALYQGTIVIPGMRQALESPQALPAFQLAGLSRGAGATISVPAGTPWLALTVDIPPDLRFPQYTSIVTSGSRTVFRVTVAAPRDAEPISVLVPARKLSPGDYQFTVYGMNADGQQRDRVSSSDFHFQFQ